MGRQEVVSNVPMDFREQVELALRNYGDLPPLPMSEGLSEIEQHLATPDRVAFALGWVVANAIVGARYADSAIDALPVFHPENGWDRFLLTRRVTSALFQEEPADSFGLIMLSGEDAPRITHGNGETRLALGGALREDPEHALADILTLFPSFGLPEQDLGMYWEERQQRYPMLYNVVTELILEHPGVVVAREIFVDDQPVDGAYHPLYLHGVALHPRMVYDFFLVQFGDRAAFFRLHGGQSIYETDRGGWATVRKQLSEEGNPDDVKRRLLGWLRIVGAPQPDTVD
ncbi:MAG TPA: hypothetical protein VMU89_01690 [Thermomicrobiaceae bacterium]|nr:hypothetical protein [Thermomicrobiaceae bacterium]